MRTSFLFDGPMVDAEMSPPNKVCPEPRLWSMLDGQTPEIEVLEFLYALARLIKPGYVVETRAWHGYTAQVIGKALKANGFGRLVALESDADCFAVAAGRIATESLSEVVDIRQHSAANFAPEQVINLLVLDSQLDHHASELRHLLPRLAAGCIVIVSDSGARRGKTLQNAGSLAAIAPLRGFSPYTPRGLVVFQYTGNPTGA